MNYLSSVYLLKKLLLKKVLKTNFLLFIIFYNKKQGYILKFIQSILVLCPYLRLDFLIVYFINMVEVTGIEPATSWSQTTRATNCATPRNKYLLKSTYLIYHRF